MQTIEERLPRLQPQKTETKAEHLLPAVARSWPVLALTWVAPMLVLAAINAHALWLCWGEMVGKERTLGYVVVAATLLSLAGGVAHCTNLIRKRKPLSSLGALIPLVAQSAFLVLATFTIPHMIPQAVRDWMLPIDRLLLQQWTFVMPGAFYGVLVLSGFRISNTSLKSAGMSTIIMLAAPFAAWASIMILEAVKAPQLAEVVALVSLFTSVTILMGGGLLRLLLIGYRSMATTGKDVQLIGVAVLTLVLPISGLILNRYIPFPVDFQHPLVYILTILNGAGLMATTASSQRTNHAVWFCRWATLPFTLYFFFVFLPYLPLSIPAMLAVLAGFLILAPTILLVIHVLRLRQAYQHLEGRPAVYAATAALAFSIIPGYLLLETYWMKGQLDQSIAYVLSPDVSSPQAFEGQPAFATKSFDVLNDFKSGVYYPILTPLRSQILFNGLLLPDQKLDRLSKAFSAEPLPRPEDNFRAFQFFGMSEGSVWSLNRAPVAPPLPQASLHQASATALSYPDGSMLTRIRLEMIGGANGQSEFKTALQLPEGAWVSGFALYIGDERVQGRLFEEKTALWVYRMIRDADRQVLVDPATLTYESDGTLRLQVFPLNPNEIRVCEIDVLSMLPSRSVLVGDTSVSLAAGALPQSEEPVLVDLQAGVGVAAPSGAIPPSSAFVRSPYLHIFVDRSAQGLDAEQLRSRLDELRAAFPNVEQVQLTLANLNAADLTSSPVGWEEAVQLGTTALDEGLPREGGFLAGHALARAAYQVSQSKDAADWLRRPVWVILSNDSSLQGDSRVAAGNLDYDPELWAPFARLMPDVAAPLILRRGHEPMPANDATPVQLIRVGDGYALAQPGKAAWLRFYDAGPAADLEVYQASEGIWQQVAISTVDGLPTTVKQAGLFDFQLARLALNPAGWEAALAEIVGRSKELNILTPATAFTVVENSAQWKTLEEKERQKLSAAGALDFDETPEPSIYLMAALAILMIGAQRLIKARRARSI